MISEIRRKVTHWPMCNNKPKRTFIIFNYPLPLCSRCIGAIIGTLAASLINVKGYNEEWFLILNVFFLLPLIIDGLVQKYHSIESTNRRRIVTGFLFGLGMVFLIQKIQNIF